MRAFAKRVALMLATLAVLPALLSFHLRSLVIGPDRALEGSSQALAWLPA